MSKSPQNLLSKQAGVSHALDLGKSSGISSVTSLSSSAASAGNIESPNPSSSLSTKSSGNEGSKSNGSGLSVQYIVCCKCGKHRAVPG